MLFQKEHGLEVDGIAGPVTMKKLNSLETTKYKISVTVVGETKKKAVDKLLKKYKPTAKEVQE